LGLGGGGLSVGGFGNLGQSGVECLLPTGLEVRSEDVERMDGWMGLRPRLQLRVSRLSLRRCLELIQ
jgi:hypothetical protein